MLYSATKGNPRDVLGRTQARWICPEGTVPRGEPVPKQDFCQWGAHATAEEKIEKEGAAGRSYLAPTVNTLPHIPHGERVWGTGMKISLRKGREKVLLSCLSFCLSI